MRRFLEAQAVAERALMKVQRSGGLTEEQFETAREHVSAWREHEAIAVSPILAPEVLFIWRAWERFGPTYTVYTGMTSAVRDHRSEHYAPRRDFLHDLGLYDEPREVIEFAWDCLAEMDDAAYRLALQRLADRIEEEKQAARRKGR